MIQKEEDTVVLLSPDERQAEDQRSVNCRKKNSFIASSFAASCLCGAGIFISNLIMWCREPGVICKNTELIRFCVLIGGIISALISGRAVDFYGRRPSLVFAAICWLIATTFIIFLPLPAINSQNMLGVSSQDLAVYGTSSFDVTSTYLINSFENRISVSQPQNPPLGFHSPPTQPSSIHSISLQKNVPHINIPRQGFANLYVGNSSHDKFVSQDSNVDSLSKALDSDRQFSSLIPFIVSNLFIGAASTASVISASVYVYETSQINFRAHWLSLSDFFSALFALFLPVIHSHILILTTTACLPIIVLSLLLLLPLNIPNCLSLPHSPYHLILASIVQKRKSSRSNRDKFGNVDGNVSPNKKCKPNPLSYVFNSFGKTTHRFANNFKIPFNSTKSKIYDINSRKNSAGDSDDSSCCMNDFAKHVELETELEKLQPVQIENHSWADTVHYKRSNFEEGNELLLGESSKSISVTEEGSSSSAIRDFEVESNYLENEDESVVSFGAEREGLEASIYKNAQSESNDCDRDEQLEGSNITIIQEKCRGQLEMKVMWQETEARRILRHLYGSKKGQEEWETIHKAFLEDTDSTYSYTKSFFIFDMKNFQPTIHAIFKIGLPLIIIHMCASDYGETVAVSETIMSKLRFCDVSPQTAVSTLQVVSAGISVALLDKIGNQVVLLGSAMVMATSLMALGFLSPYVRLLADGPHSPLPVNPVTPSPSIPTMYPLLPTPLPQILHNKQNTCMESQWKDSHFGLFNQIGSAQHGHIYITSQSPIIWLTAISIVLSVVAGSLILAPLTRLTLLSAFPTHGRGNGVGISFAIQYSIRLVIFFLPYKLHSSSLGLIFRAGACFSSIIALLCFLSIKNRSQCCCLQRNSYNKRFFHLLSDGKICNMSTTNSTAV